MNVEWIKTYYYYYCERPFICLFVCFKGRNDLYQTNRIRICRVPRGTTETRWSVLRFPKWTLYKYSNLIVFNVRLISRTNSFPWVDWSFILLGLNFWIFKRIRGERLWSWFDASFFIKTVRINYVTISLCTFCPIHMNVNPKCEQSNCQRASIVNIIKELFKNYVDKMRWISR